MIAYAEEPMFTGIIEAMTEVLANDRKRLILERPRDFKDLRQGSSICVSGACLTVVARTKTSLSFQLTRETRRRTTLGSLRKGDRVNLERALAVGGHFEGHMVQGHVEGVGKVLEVKSGYLIIAIPKAFLPFVVEKGSIAIDGVSLTVAQLQENRCTIATIPYTLSHTTLGSLKAGDNVNIETDVLARYAHKWPR